MIVRGLALLVLFVSPLVGSTQETVPQPSKPDARLTQVVYPVADLVVPIAGLDYPHDSAQETKTKEDWLIQKITQGIAPRSWSESGGPGTIQYSPGSMSMVVKQTAQVHAQVSDLLETMVRAQNIEVSLETRVVTVSNGLYAELRPLFPHLKKHGQLICSAAEVFTLLAKAQADADTNVMQFPKITSCSGQRASLGVTDKLDAKLKASVAVNLCHVDLDVSAKVDNKVQFDKAARLVDGTTLVLSAPKDQQTSLLLLVTPRVIINLSEPRVIINVSEAAANKIDPRDPVSGAAPRVLPVAPPVADLGAREANRDVQVVQVEAAALTPAPILAQPTAKPAPDGKMLMFQVRIHEGDPLGSESAGTLRTLAEPRIMTLENQSFTFQAGGEVPYPVVTGTTGADLQGVSFLHFGLTVTGTPGRVKDGQVRLDITVSMAKRGDQADDRLQVHSETTQAIMTLKLNDVVKLRLGKGTADKQMWVELTFSGYPGTLGAMRGLTPVPPLPKPVFAPPPSAQKRPAARVGQIIIVGNDKTPDAVIRKHLGLFPGQVLDYPSLGVAEKNLANLDLFVVDVDNGIRPTITVLDPEKNKEYVDILVTVQELQPERDANKILNEIRERLQWLEDQLPKKDS